MLLLLLLFNFLLSLTYFIYFTLKKIPNGLAISDIRIYEGELVDADLTSEIFCLDKELEYTNYGKPCGTSPKKKILTS